MSPLKEKVDVKKQVVVDTDCGSDDAMALMLAFSGWGRSVADVLAVTTCFGNADVDHTTLNVLRVMHVCGQTKVPVYKGSAGPLINHPDKPEIVHGEDGFGGSAHRFSTGDLSFEEGAVQALCRLSREHPSDLTLVTLGPLTNVALAHRLDPGFTARLKEVVCLGGNYKGVGNTTEMAEFNFYCDVESAHMVLTEAECPVTLIPWETMMEHGNPWDDFHALMSVPNDRARVLKAATAVVVEHCRKEGDPSFMDCDFLAMAAALLPRSVTDATDAAVAVESEGRHTRGAVVCKKDGRGKKMVRIVKNFDDCILAQLRAAMLND